MKKFIIVFMFIACISMSCVQVYAGGSDDDETDTGNPFYINTQYKNNSSVVSNGFYCEYELTVPYTIDFSTLLQGDERYERTHGLYRVNNVKRIAITAKNVAGKKVLGVFAGEDSENLEGGYFWEFEIDSTGIYVDTDELSDDPVIVFGDDSDKSFYLGITEFEPYEFVSDMVRSGGVCPGVISLKRTYYRTLLTDERKADYQLLSTNALANGFNNDMTYELQTSKVGIDTSETSTYHFPDETTTCLFRNPLVKSCKSFVWNAPQQYENLLGKFSNTTIEYGIIKDSNIYIADKEVKYLYIKSDAGVAYKIYIDGDNGNYNDSFSLVAFDGLYAEINSTRFTIYKDDFEKLFSDSFDINNIGIAYGYDDRTSSTSNIFITITEKGSDKFKSYHNPKSIEEKNNTMTFGSWDDLAELMYNTLEEYEKNKYSYTSCSAILADRKILLKQYDILGEMIANGALAAMTDIYRGEMSETAKKLNNARCYNPDTSAHRGVLTCEGLYGKNNEVKDLIDNILKFIQYGGPILMILLTIMDLIKTATSGEEKDFKNVFQKFIKRFIAAALLFFVKDIIELLFLIVGIDTGC